MEEAWVTKNAREHVASEERRHEAERSNNSAWRLRKALRWLASLLARRPTTPRTPTFYNLCCDCTHHKCATQWCACRAVCGRRHSEYTG